MDFMMLASSIGSGVAAHAARLVPAATDKEHDMNLRMIQQMNQRTKQGLNQCLHQGMHQGWRRATCAAVFLTLFGGAYGFSSHIADPPTVPTTSSTASSQQPKTDPVVDLTALDKIGDGCWSELRTRRVYFAHHEIGTEIVAGLAEAMRRKPGIKLTVAAYTDPDTTDAATQSVFDTPMIVEENVGDRGDPEKKIHEFSRFLRSTEGAKIDCAMLKLCYGDIGRTTNTDALIDRYAAAVTEIQRDRPNVHLIHCTVALKGEEQGAKARIKRLVGAGSDASNAARGRFNDALRKRFPTAQVFDIAAAESRRPDGTMATVEVGGKRVQVLASEYTDDGAHLNRMGQIVLAREFLLALTKQCGGDASPATGTTSVSFPGGEPGGQ